MTTRRMHQNSLQPIYLADLQPQPLVSVIVANYNYGRFISEAIESVRSQTYGRWELIICDDGSTDESRRVLERWQSQDPRIDVILKANGGQASAWNRAFEYAAGEIIALLDADDWYRADKLERVVETFRNRPRAGFLYHPLQPTHESGEPATSPFPGRVPHGWLVERAIRDGGHAFVSTTALCMRREIAEILFPIPVEVEAYGDAYLGQTATFLTEIAAISEPLTYYRQHDENHAQWLDPIDPSASAVAIASKLIVFEHQRQFLSQRFGPEVASLISLRDRRALWERLGATYIAEGKPEGGVAGYSPDEIKANLFRSRRGKIWRVLFALPSTPAIRLLLIWWSRSWWKPYVRGLSQKLGIADRTAG